MIEAIQTSPTSMTTCYAILTVVPSCVNCGTLSRTSTLLWNPFITPPSFQPSMKQLRKDMGLSHLGPALQERIYNIICRHWSVFDEKGIFVPVKHYECVIDTGNAWPISQDRKKI